MCMNHAIQPEHYTNPPNKCHPQNHIFQSHLQPRSVSHTHFFSLSQTHKVTAFPLTRSVLKPQAPQIAIITSLPLCLLSGSLLHVVKLSHPAVTPTPKESTAPSSMLELKIRKRPPLVCNYYPGT